MPISSPNKELAAVLKATEKKKKAARARFKIAAEQNNSQGLNNFAFMVQYGLGGAEDKVQARELYLKSIKLGNHEAMYNLAYMLEYGYGADKNLEQARDLYEMSANLGNHQAMYALATMLEEGTGGNKDEKRAKELYKQSADQGNRDAVAAFEFMERIGRGEDSIEEVIPEVVNSKENDNDDQLPEYNEAKVKQEKNETKKNESKEDVVALEKKVELGIELSTQPESEESNELEGAEANVQDDINAKKEEADASVPQPQSLEPESESEPAPEPVSVLESEPAFEPAPAPAPAPETETETETETEPALELSVVDSAIPNTSSNSPINSAFTLHALLALSIVSLSFLIISIMAFAIPVAAPLVIGTALCAATINVCHSIGIIAFAVGATGLLTTVVGEEMGPRFFRPKVAPSTEISSPPSPTVTGT